jgi:molybdate transport system ATP-binding protein
MIALRLALQRPGFALDVDLSLPAAGVTALYGPSGCGKTTVLRAVAGLERARGRVAMGDETWQDDERGVWAAPHRRPLGYVIQESALFPHLDVAANLAYGRRRSGADGARVDLPALVDLLGIGTLMGRRPATLSGGERQRVAIARALATGPRLLLMDEPLAALDAPRRAEILPYLEQLSRRLALPVLYVTHAMDEVARLADHLVLMQAGRVTAQGPLADLLAQPGLPLPRSAQGQDEAGVVIAATVVEHDAPYGLSRVAFEGGSLWLGQIQADATPSPGRPVRVRVMARDVSLALDAAKRSSILNVLPATVTALQPDGATVLVALACGDGPVRLLSRVTRRSADLLGLAPGLRVYAQVKGVSLM